MTKQTISEKAIEVWGDSVSSKIRAFVSAYTPRPSTRLDTLSKEIKFEIALSFAEKGEGTSKFENINQKVKIDIKYEGKIWVEEPKGWVVFSPEIEISWKGGREFISGRDGELFKKVCKSLRIQSKVVVEISRPVCFVQETHWYSDDFGGQEVVLQALHFKN